MTRTEKILLGAIMAFGLIMTIGMVTVVRSVRPSDPAPARDRVYASAVAYTKELAASYDAQVEAVRSGEVKTVDGLIAAIKASREATRNDFTAVLDKAVRACADDKGVITDRQGAADVLRQAGKGLAAR